MPLKRDLSCGFFQAEFRFHSPREKERIGWAAIDRERSG